MRPYDQVVAQRAVMLDSIYRWGFSDELDASMRALSMEIADHIAAGATLEFQGAVYPVNSSMWCVTWPPELFTNKSIYKPFQILNPIAFKLLIPPGSL